MSELVKKLSGKVMPLVTGTPAETISIKVPREALKGANDNGLRKTDFIARINPFCFTKRLCVEAAESGTNDSIFFAPEAPNADQCHARVTPTQFIKVKPEAHDDVVHIGDDYEISFVGMSVTPQDMFGANDLLLCSFTREDKADDFLTSKKKNTAHLDDHAMSPTLSPTTTTVSSATASSSTSPPESSPMGPLDDADLEAEKPKVRAEDLPTTLRVNPHDIPFIHYDPVIDGHDVGNKPDTFVPIPGTKRLYKQRRGKGGSGTDASPAVFMRFTVMEIDKLSEEQLAAIKSIENIAGSVSKAAASVPYLKVVSWMLKFANNLGKSALKKVSTPDHVMSQDVRFKIANPVNSTEESNSNEPHEEYGNYLRYGYYYFLSRKVDAKLYVQTGASSQTVPLLLRRFGYNPKFAMRNEKEYFPLTGVSYVTVKVSRGCSPLHSDRKELIEKHRERLVKLLAKYSSQEEEEAKK